ncbi:hypothetical protein CANCADRAFT_3572 [Tortispora caseinolytica NRRL Y-17796]|uniref:Putative gamma-glutamylcyclotransferase n=1 Tax=Tortispora caseinolytica NRRL Y-17796 TaxID=767744 RepID=A0A1E4TB01_9ASCO|nr:hypothetical protein CANCADRAFT_3572 [Tortispora caseinolytica NRRL Y-17796]
MTPEVLGRVTNGSTKPLDSIVVHPARLNDYSRRKLKGRDYPGITPSEGAYVDGTVAFNLTEEDVAKLDVFEGDEYKRVAVKVLDLHSQMLVDAWVYEWAAGSELLLDEEWDLSVFVKEKMKAWIAEEMEYLGEHDPRGARFWNPAVLQ